MCRSNRGGRCPVVGVSIEVTHGVSVEIGEVRECGGVSRLKTTTNVRESCVTDLSVFFDTQTSSKGLISHHQSNLVHQRLHLLRGCRRGPELRELRLETWMLGDVCILWEGHDGESRPITLCKYSNCKE